MLLKAEVPVVSTADCNESYEKGNSITDRQICAGGVGDLAPCGAGGGGPIQTIENLNGNSRYVQQGVLSYGKVNCGTLGIPEVYTKVASYMDWILDTIRL